MNNFVLNKVWILLFFLYGLKANDSNLKKGIDFFKGDIEKHWKSQIKKIN